jgi:hypothetical protein
MRSDSTFVALLLAMLVFPRHALAQVEPADAIQSALHDTIGYVSFGADEYVAQLLESQLTTFPVATSSGAFIYSFDPTSRTFTRQARTFGPSFVERASTLGRRHAFAFGGSIQPVRFTALGGRRLSESPFYIRQGYADGRLIRHSVALTLSQVTTAVFGAYAVNPSVDVSVVVPFSRVSFRGVLTGDLQQFDSGTVTSTGLGDVEARAKWAAWRGERVEAAAWYTIRLPTGMNLTPDSGRAQQKIAVLLSSRVGHVQYHVNAGYSFRVAGQSPGESVEKDYGGLGHDAASNEAVYGVAIEWPLHPRLTFAGELIGRLLKDGVEFQESTIDDTQTRDPEDVGLTYRLFKDSLISVSADQHIVLGSVGMKYRIVGNTVVGAHVLLPLSNDALRPAVALVIGCEYGF